MDWTPIEPNEYIGVRRTPSAPIIGGYRVEEGVDDIGKRWYRVALCEKQPDGRPPEGAPIEELGPGATWVPDGQPTP